MVNRQGYSITQGFTIWLTGLSGAGKSTIANALREHLSARGLLNLAILDGDDLRKTLCKDLGFTREDRDANIRRIGFLGQALTRYGVPNVVAVISPYREIREEVRGMIPTFLEVYVSCPLEVCEQRDVKGLYAKARLGEIKMFTGIDDPYEPPENPEVTVYTERETLQEIIEKIMNALLVHDYLKIKSLEEELWQDTQEITPKLKNGLAQLNPPTSLGR
jgi:adenylylsulfate kinase